jgi:site-specific DNA-methyltransferase (adenine-specific)
MPTIPDASIDHVITDIPYGIDMEILQDWNDLDRVKDEHDVEYNKELMRPFLEQSFRVLRDGGFCVFFYDLDHHNDLMTAAFDIGFKVQKWPLVWCKEHTCKNNAANFNWTKSTEFAMVLRKGAASLLLPQAKSYFLCDGQASTKLFNNPFAKPKDLWDWILKAVARPGEKVLDPFAGVGSSTLAAIQQGNKPIAIELSDKHFPHLLENVKKQYKATLRTPIEFK